MLFLFDKDFIPKRIQYSVVREFNSAEFLSVFVKHLNWKQFLLLMERSKLREPIQFYANTFDYSCCLYFYMRRYFHKHQ